MANSPQARKRARQAEKRRRHNASQRSMIRTYVKRVRAAIDENDAEKAQAELTAAIPVLDRMAGKGRLHANNVARQKSRLNAQIRKLASS